MQAVPAPCQLCQLVSTDLRDRQDTGSPSERRLPRLAKRGVVGPVIPHSRRGEARWWVESLGMTVPNFFQVGPDGTEMEGAELRSGSSQRGPKMVRNGRARNYFWEKNQNKKRSEFGPRCKKSTLQPLEILNRKLLFMRDFQVLGRKGSNLQPSDPESDVLTIRPLPNVY